jgi:eukaryotic-like serine/threonine-protein kinase
MSQALSGVSAASSSQNVTTLRAQLDARVKSGERFRLSEVVAIVVPLCAEIAALHAKGEPVYVHPAAIGSGPDGTPHVIASLARTKPSGGRDAAAIAPELASSAPTARSSVYGVGAIVYEMLTLQPVGAGMKPPTQLVPELPPIVDQILAKALVADASERPADLPAFAQAIHHFAPKSIAPPPMVEDSSFEVDIDVSMSMVPPAAGVPAVSGRIPTMNPFGTVVDARVSEPVRPSNSASEELAALKARLEADPAPRWIVVKDKMDHGPFAAIELLQQIVSNSFKPLDLLVDTHTGKKVVIKDHPEFSRFAHHAHLRREEIAETKAVIVAEKREKVAAAGKTTIGILAVAGVLTVAGLVFWRIQAKRAEDAKRRAEEEAMSIAGEGSIAGQKKAVAPKVGGGGGGGAWGGKSYDDALKNSVSDMDADTLSTKECAAPVGGDIAASCGLNGSATAKIVVKNGRAAGVTVTTDPSQPGVNSCMAGRISGLSWRSVAGATGCIRTFKAH